MWSSIWAGAEQAKMVILILTRCTFTVGEVQIKNVKKVVEYSDLYIMNSWKMWTLIDKNIENSNWSWWNKAIVKIHKYNSLSEALRCFSRNYVFLFSKFSVTLWFSVILWFSIWLVFFKRKLYKRAIFMLLNYQFCKKKITFLHFLEILTEKERKKKCNIWDDF